MKRLWRAATVPLWKRMFRPIMEPPQPPSHEEIKPRTATVGETITAYEYHEIHRARCPDCASHHLIRGPKAGLSTNIACAACGSEFNVTPDLRTAERNSTRGSPDADRLRQIFEINL